MRGKIATFGKYPRECTKQRLRKVESLYRTLVTLNQVYVRFACHMVYIAYKEKTKRENYMAEAQERI